MKLTRIGLSLIVAMTFVQPIDAAAQLNTGWAERSALQTIGFEMQQERRFGEKSPALAGLLSFLIFPGVGSFYGGNSGHGVRHLVIGGATIIGAVAGLSAACNDDFNLCDEDDAGYTVGGIFLLGYLVNWVWGGVTAIGDANAYNRDLRASALRFSPSVVRLAGGENTVGLLGSTRVRTGIRIMQVTF